MLTIVLIWMVAGGVVVWGLSSLLWHQNPSVPEGAVNFQITPAISEGSDQSSAWVWDGGANSFTMSITLTNNRNSPWLPSISAFNIPSGWAFSTSTLSPIAASGGSLAITLTVHYSSGTPNAGPIGDFSVSIS